MPKVLLEETPRILALAMENGGLAMDRPPKSEVGSLFKRFLSHSFKRHKVTSHTFFYCIDFMVSGVLTFLIDFANLASFSQEFDASFFKDS